MELEVGMYVRTKWGKIGKIIDISKSFDVTNIDNPISYERYEVDTNYNFEDEPDGYFKEDISKASHNLLGNDKEPCLIEVGDYVNGDLVLFAGATTWDNDGNVLDKQVHINHNGCDWWLREKYIKSIVTKEQFESMQYRIGE